MEIHRQPWISIHGLCTDLHFSCKLIWGRQFRTSFCYRGANKHAEQGWRVFCSPSNTIMPLVWHMVDLLWHRRESLLLLQSMEICHCLLEVLDEGDTGRGTLIVCLSIVLIPHARELILLLRLNRLSFPFSPSKPMIHSIGQVILLSCFAPTNLDFCRTRSSTILRSCATELTDHFVN